MSAVSKEEELNKRYEIFIGRNFKGGTFEVKGGNLVEYSKAITDENEKYTKAKDDDYSGIVAHPAYPARLMLGGVGGMYALEFDGGEKVIKNMGLLLHTGQEYDYTDCAEIKDGQILSTESKISEIFVKGSILWIKIEIITRKENGDKVVTITSTFGIRKGGY